jgi:hypothetical protein
MLKQTKRLSWVCRCKQLQNLRVVELQENELEAAVPFLRLSQQIAAAGGSATW